MAIGEDGKTTREEVDKDDEMTVKVDLLGLQSTSPTTIVGKDDEAMGWNHSGRSPQSTSTGDNSLWDANEEESLLDEVLVVLVLPLKYDILRDDEQVNESNCVTLKRESSP